LRRSGLVRAWHSAQPKGGLVLAGLDDAVRGGAGTQNLEDDNGIVHDLSGSGDGGAHNHAVLRPTHILNQSREVDSDFESMREDQTKLPDKPVGRLKI
jgi:hypothetical protein